jgi:hypothetical protein
MFERVKEKFPTLKGFSTDAGYEWTSVDHVKKEMRLKVEI